MCLKKDLDINKVLGGLKGFLICKMSIPNWSRLLKRQNQEYKTVLVVSPNVKTQLDCR